MSEWIAFGIERRNKAASMAVARAGWGGAGVDLRGQPPTVAVVKTTDSTASLDSRYRAGRPLDCSAGGSVLIDSEMSPVS